jgi:hypothetical protein
MRAGQKDTNAATVRVCPCGYARGIAKTGTVREVGTNDGATPGDRFPKPRKTQRGVNDKCFQILQYLTCVLIAVSRF